MTKKTVHYYTRGINKLSLSEKKTADVSAVTSDSQRVLRADCGELIEIENLT